MDDLFLADRLQPDEKFLFANVHCRQDFRRGLLLFIVGFTPTLSNVKQHEVILGLAHQLNLDGVWTTYLQLLLDLVPGRHLDAFMSDPEVLALPVLVDHHHRHFETLRACPLIMMRDLARTSQICCGKTSNTTDSVYKSHIAARSEEQPKTERKSLRTKTGDAVKQVGRMLSATRPETYETHKNET